MKKSTWLMIALVALLWLVMAPASQASNAIAKQEGGLVCTACHDKPGSKLLTDQGKYYETTGSLEGFDELESSFGRCTYCHVKKPGSLKLTKVGKRYQWMMDDMEGVKEWLIERHIEDDGPPPAPPVSNQQPSESRAPSRE